MCLRIDFECSEQGSLSLLLSSFNNAHVNPIPIFLISRNIFYEICVGRFWSLVCLQNSIVSKTSIHRWCYEWRGVSVMYEIKKAMCILLFVSFSVSIWLLGWVKLIYFSKVALPIMPAICSLKCEKVLFLGYPLPLVILSFSFSLAYNTISSQIVSQKILFSIIFWSFLAESTWTNLVPFLA